MLDILTPPHVKAAQANSASVGAGATAEATAADEAVAAPIESIEKIADLKLGADTMQSEGSAPAGQESGVKGTEISAQDRKDLRSDTINYDAQRMIGHGSFGAVFLAKVVETDEMVAIKKVLQDKRFKNRELQIMRQLVKQPHPYVVALKHHFVSKGSKSDDVYLNL
ncbi:hypothetical protein B484DRAFT_425716, partial [Ochromonadaceae sp. CCMP2298]